MAEDVGREIASAMGDDPLKYREDWPQDFVPQWSVTPPESVVCVRYSSGAMMHMTCYVTPAFEDWAQTHLRTRYTFRGPIFPEIIFEDQADAAIFKLAWLHR